MQKLDYVKCEEDRGHNKRNKKRERNFSGAVKSCLEEPVEF